MKKIMLAFFVTLTSVTMSAKETPQRGFVITINNDTIKGNIDYHTDEENTRNCIFKADDKSEYITYSPGEIVGYRFEKNGKFYVTKELEYNGKKHQVFAEYMMNGMLNVYRVIGVDNDPVFFFENEKGEMLSYRSHKPTEDFERKEMLKSAQQLFTFLSKTSQKASGEVKVDPTKPMTTSQILNIARTYHEDVCTSGENCIEYKKKKNGFHAKFNIHAGTARFFLSSPFADDAPAYTFTAGLGCDIDFCRYAKGMYVQLGAEYLSTKELYLHGFDYDYQPHSWVTLRCGLMYATGKEGNPRFTLRAGLMPYIFITPMTAYVGIGTEIPLSSNALIFNLDIHSGPFLSEVKSTRYTSKPRMSLTMGYKF